MDKFGTEMTELLPEESEEEQTAAVREEPPSHTRSGMVEGRNAIQEALRSGKTADRLYIQDGLRDPAIGQIVSKVKKQGATVSYVKKQQLDQMSETGRHQGVILQCSAYEYASMEDIFKNAEEKGEPPFIFLLDEIEINTDGTMQQPILKSWQAAVEDAINNQMTAAGELSNVEGSGCKFFINPAQNVLATSKVEGTLKVRPFGYARDIIVNIGFLTANS